MENNMVEGVPKEERTEQWKENGECLKCRRHGYCKKQCKKNKELMYAEIRRIFNDKLKENGIPTPEQMKGEE